MSSDVLTVVQKLGTFPNNWVQCDSCMEKVLGYRFSSEPFRWYSFKKPKQREAA
jgi:hypothetical protein